MIYNSSQHLHLDKLYHQEYQEKLLSLHLFYFFLDFPYLFLLVILNIKQQIFRYYRYRPEQLMVLN